MMYAGNIFGLAQDFEAWLEGLRRLSGLRDSWIALVVGDGVRRPWLERRVASWIWGVQRPDPAPPTGERLSALLGAATLHVVPL